MVQKQRPIMRKAYPRTLYIGIYRIGQEKTASGNHSGSSVHEQMSENGLSGDPAVDLLFQDVEREGTGVQDFVVVSAQVELFT